MINFKLLFVLLLFGGTLVAVHQAQSSHRKTTTTTTTTTTHRQTWRGSSPPLSSSSHHRTHSSYSSSGSSAEDEREVENEIDQSSNGSGGRTETIGRSASASKGKSVVCGAISQVYISKCRLHYMRILSFLSSVSMAVNGQC